MYDFHCDQCGTTQERYLEAAVKIVGCACGHVAERVMAAPRANLDGTDDGFPGAYDRWARIREDNARLKAKSN